MHSILLIINAYYVIIIHIRYLRHFMRFNSEEERKSHPEAGLIPTTIWNDKSLFNKRMPQGLIELMQANEKTRAALLTEYIPALDVSQKKCTWLALALLNPSMSNQALLNMTHELGLSAYDALIMSLQIGKIGLFKQVFNATFNKKKLIQRNNNELFATAIQYGRIEVAKLLFKNMSSFLSNLFQIQLAGSCPFVTNEILNQAVINGHSDILAWLIPFQLKGKTDSFSDSKHLDELFVLAAASGQIAIMNQIIAMAPEKMSTIFIDTDPQKGMVNPCWPKYEKVACKAFNRAVENADIDVMKWLLNNAPDPTSKNELLTNSSNPITLVAKQGKLEAIKYLTSQSPGLYQQFVSGEGIYSAIEAVAKAGDVDALKYLLDIAPGKQKAQEMAISTNNHDVIEYFLESKRTTIRTICTDSNQFSSIMHASRNCANIKLVNKLLDHISKPDFLNNSGNYTSTKTYKNIFQHAMLNNRLDIIEAVIKSLPGLKALLSETIKDHARSYWIVTSSENKFNWLVENPTDDYPCIEQTKLKNYLLQYPGIFSYMEEQREYDVLATKPFISQKLRELRQKKIDIEQINSNALLNIDKSEAETIFYILRNMIRRNDSALIDDIIFLLEIPAVKALVHTDMGRSANELLRLAITTGNITVATYLLDIPAVKNKAEADNYYILESITGVGLEHLAKHSESSTYALSVGETRRLQGVIDHYNPKIKATTVPVIMTELRTTLESRYNENPAVVKRDNGNSLKLPLSYEAFKMLGLSSDEKARELTAYYSNKSHTAWRYLLKPNPWMHQNPYYPSSECLYSIEKWSSFEEYQSLISMFFLAAKDNEMPAIDGFTIDTRLDYFISELAMIGRAHNWDESRPRLDANGNCIYDSCGNPIFEEYDNLQGDNPTCVSGVKRHLFVSVLGHSLLKILTPDTFNAEVRTFVRKHFEAMITEENSTLLKVAWNKNIVGDDLNKEEIDLLKSLEITPSQIRQFNNELTLKYGRQFSEENIFQIKLKNLFAMKGKADIQMFNLGHYQIDDLFLGNEKLFTYHLTKLKKKAAQLNENIKFNDQVYKEVAGSAIELCKTLDDARSDYFLNKKIDLNTFKETCVKAINSAKKEFKIERGILKDFDPIFKALLGILAAITFLPMVLVEIKSKHGYINTFFQPHKTDSLEQLESFESNIEEMFPEDTPTQPIKGRV